MSYEDDMRKKPKELAKTYPFCPRTYGTFSPWTFNDEQVNKIALSGQFTGFNEIGINRDYLIAKVKLEIGQDRGAGCLHVVPSVGKSGEGLPVYFLPWDNRGAAVCMRIPDRDPGLPEGEHPTIFFTAVLSGCSIIFKGTAQAPIIYHCGTEGGTVGTPTQGDSNDFFSQMLSGPGRLPIGAIIKSSEYMNPIRNPSKAVGDLETKYRDHLQDLSKSKGFFVIKSVSAWGACFGVRKGRDWKFYVQKNGTIDYSRLEYVKSKTPTDTVLHRERTIGPITMKSEQYVTKVTHNFLVAKPIEVQRVFPGPGTVKLGKSWSVMDL